MSRAAFVCVAAVAVVVAAAGGARASTDFPTELKNHLTADSAPLCTICHTNNVGGLGTVTKAFGQNMMANGCSAGDVTSLNAALDAVEAAATDTDGDGTGDIDELRVGRDPNVVDNDVPPGQVDTLQYGFFGCGATSSPATSLVPFAALLAAWSLARRSHRRRR